jgi:hypothetical protein
MGGLRGIHSVESFEPRAGTVLFDGAGPGLERLDTVDTPEATHVTYRVGQVTR